MFMIFELLVVLVNEFNVERKRNLMFVGELVNMMEGCVVLYMVFCDSLGLIGGNVANMVWVQWEVMVKFIIVVWRG